MTKLNLGLGVFGFLLFTAYCPFITGAGTTPRWAVMALGACAVLFVKDVRTSPTSWCGLGFILWAIASCAWSEAPLDSVDPAWKLVVLGCLFVVAVSIDDLRPLYAGAAAGIAVSSLLVIVDRLGLISYPQASAPSGLFVNGLYLAEPAVLVAVAALGHRMWWAMAVCAPSVLLVPLARGPLVALGVVGLCEWFRRCPRDSRVPFAITLFCIGVLALYCLIALRPSTLLERFGMWQDAVAQVTTFGHGLGSYFATIPAHSVNYDIIGLGTRNDHANNDLLEIAYELGAPGLALALWFCAFLLVGADCPERTVCGAFLLEGLVGFPLHLPATAALFAICAGACARRWSMGVDLAVPRGVALRQGLEREHGAGLARSSDRLG